MELIKLRTQRVKLRDKSRDVFLEDISWCDSHYHCEPHQFVVTDHSAGSKELWLKGFSEEEKFVPFYFNPVTRSYLKASEFLSTVIFDMKVLWLANMVTYYRHQLPSWNRCWGNNGHRYRHGWFGDYESEKQNVNERQKRKVLRKHLEFLKVHGIGVEHFRQLRFTDQKTIDFAELRFNGKKNPKSSESIHPNEVF